MTRAAGPCPELAAPIKVKSTRALRLRQVANSQTRRVHDLAMNRWLIERDTPHVTTRKASLRVVAPMRAAPPIPRPASATAQNVRRRKWR
jgi:hypothetical protein